MNLQQQIEQLKTNPIVGGVQWRPTQYDNNFECTIAGITFDITYSEGDGKTSEFAIYNSKDLYVTSTTLNEALLEALAIVKAKVMELAKELGFVCLDKEQMSLIKEAVPKYYNLQDIVLDKINLMDNPNKFQLMRKTHHQNKKEQLNALKQYLTEQGNE